MKRTPRRLAWGAAFIVACAAFAARPPAVKLLGAEGGMTSGMATSPARYLEVYRGPGYPIDPNDPSGHLYEAGASAILATEYDYHDFGARYEDGALRYVANGAAHAFSYGNDPGEYLGRVQSAGWQKVTVQPRTLEGQMVAQGVIDIDQETPDPDAAVSSGYNSAGGLAGFWFRVVEPRAPAGQKARVRYAFVVESERVLDPTFHSYSQYVGAVIGYVENNDPNGPEVFLDFSQYSADQAVNFDHRGVFEVPPNIWVAVALSNGGGLFPRVPGFVGEADFNTRAHVSVTLLPHKAGDEPATPPQRGRGVLLQRLDTVRATSAATRQPDDKPTK
jgi:hypothetical protein